MGATMNTPTAHFAAEPQYVPHDERRNHGKSLRDAGPREPHGHWKPANDRHDIVDHLVRRTRVACSSSSRSASVA